MKELSTEVILDYMESLLTSEIRFLEGKVSATLRTIERWNTDYDYPDKEVIAKMNQHKLRTEQEDLSKAKAALEYIKQLSQ